MDQHIRNLKMFVDGLGEREVEFPSELTPQEINLIVEMFVTAARNESKDLEAGFYTLLSKLLLRVREELGNDQTNVLITNLIKLSH